MNANTPSSRCVVVGVTQHQRDAVVLQAARFARQFDAGLVCANVDERCYVVAEHPDGSVEMRQIDPDLPDITGSDFDDELAQRIRTLVRDEGVEVTFRELAGDCAHALGRLADVLQAEMIVVGSRRRGFRASLQEYLGGSVAAHLAHRQPRPVVVVPVAPVPVGQRLPWEGSDPS